MKNVLVLITALLVSCVATQAQTTSFYTPKEKKQFTYQFNDFKSVPLTMNSMSLNEEPKGVPPALMIIGGIGMVAIGASIDPRTGGTMVPVLLIAGGIGLTTTGVFTAVSNAQTDQWE